MSYRNISTMGEFKDFIKNKSVSVVGIGISNAPLLRFLKNCEVEKITARDKKNIFEDENTRELREIPGVSFILGENYLDNLNEQVIFKTPGIRRDAEPFARAERGIFNHKIHQSVKFFHVNAAYASACWCAQR